RYPNLVVLRTFSKAMALAGLRVGYLLASPELTREIRKAILPYNLNLFSRTAGEVVLEHFGGSLQSVVQSICAERDRLFVALQGIPGLSPFPSHANFILTRTSIQPSEIYQGLLGSGILVR